MAKFDKPFNWGAFAPKKAKGGKKSGGKSKKGGNAWQNPQAVLDAEDARQPLPTMLLCRNAVDIDQAAAKLEQHAEALATHQRQRT
jgi:hypothetical protein